MIRWLILLIIVFLAIAAEGQRAAPVAPVKWETFSDREIKFSIALPKLPMRESYSDICRGMIVTTYFAYADDVVYKLGAFTKSKEWLPQLCTNVRVARFTSTEFFKSLASGQTSTVWAADSSSFSYRTENVSAWVIHDPQRNRVFELTAHRRNPSIDDDKKFIDSLVFTVTEDARPIGKGSAAILGDDNVPNSMRTDVDIAGSTVLPARIISQPRAHYTSSARDAKVNGAVRLKTELLANGAVGEVTPITRLP